MHFVAKEATHKSCHTIRLYITSTSLQSYRAYIRTRLVNISHILPFFSSPFAKFLQTLNRLKVHSIEPLTPTLHPYLRRDMKRHQSSVPPPPRLLPSSLTSHSLPSTNSTHTSHTNTSSPSPLSPILIPHIPQTLQTANALPRAPYQLTEEKESNSYIADKKHEYIDLSGARYAKFIVTLQNG